MRGPRPPRAPAPPDRARRRPRRARRSRCSRAGAPREQAAMVRCGAAAPGHVGRGPAPIQRAARLTAVGPARGVNSCSNGLPRTPRRWRARRIPRRMRDPGRLVARLSSSQTGITRSRRHSRVFRAVRSRPVFVEPSASPVGVLVGRSAVLESRRQLGPIMTDQSRALHACCARRCTGGRGPSVGCAALRAADKKPVYTQRPRRPPASRRFVCTRGGRPGGPNDYADFYCPRCSGDWTTDDFREFDGTAIRTSGKSSIQRRYSATIPSAVGDYR